jgi:hypothetical protein
LKASSAFVATLVIAVIVVSGVLASQQGGPPGTLTQTTTTASVTSTSSTATSSSTFLINATGSRTFNATDSDGLEVQLALRFYQGAGANGSLMVSMIADEYNTLPRANNVSASSVFGAQDLSLGPCGRFASPYGVALYSGTYTGANVSQAQPLQIYPLVPCPMFIRLVTGYLFQPSSDMALVLPGSGNATEMLSMVNATGLYSNGANMLSSPTPLPPGTYTAVAGDEWGALVAIQFTVSADGTATVNA